MDEHASRGVPIHPDEVQWARHRPAQHRTPLPKAGDLVRYRHDEWGPVIDAHVVEVHDDPADDPNLVSSVDGSPLPDPWPTLILDTGRGRVATREARLRGSPGWLPADWRTRFRPLPDQGSRQAAPPHNPAPRHAPNQAGSPPAPAPLMGG